MKGVAKIFEIFEIAFPNILTQTRNLFEKVCKVYKHSKDWTDMIFKQIISSQFLYAFCILAFFSICYIILFAICSNFSELNFDSN